MRPQRLLVMATLALVSIPILIGCASANRKTFFFEPNEFDPDYWVPKVDRFVIVVDASLTMADRYAGERKLDMATDLVRAMNASIPELQYDAGLRTFGQGRCLPRENTSLLTGIEAYSTASFSEAIDMVHCANGYSPLNLALEASIEDLAAADGGRAVIIVSDGRHMNKKELESARRLKERYGDQICLYPILIGADPRGRKMLSEIAGIGGCAELSVGDELTDRAAMAAFVEQALLWPDSDGDGVPDHLDQCPDTQRGVAVDEVGCPLDSDGDGVPDYLDKCPGTPKGVKVDEHGCPPKPERPAVPAWPIQGAPMFAVDRWGLDAEDKAVLDEAAEYLKANPEIVVEVQGHTDSTGPMRWNMTLSEWRAESAKRYLVSKGITEDRLTVKGYGPNQPAVPNDSRANRAKNRRVSFQPAWRQ